MSKNVRAPEMDSLPKTGRVNEMCQEWMVREDSALAYRLQHEEFDEHLSGNKFRNAVVREDFPKAKDEQMREQRMAEQAAAIYQKMLAEQEEIDNQIAKDLAEKMEREEQLKRRAIEIRDQDIARQMLEKERKRVEKHHHHHNPIPTTPPHYSPQKPVPVPPRMDIQQSSPHRPNALNYQANLPRRQAMPMPLPTATNDLYNIPSRSVDHQQIDNSAELYNEPYRSSGELNDMLNRIDIAEVEYEVGLPIDEITERQIQEKRDAELAKKLQEQEGSLEDSLLHRDRLLAIEAQDKELAKLLQDRERAKAKRARERAKQKALAKKQQQQIDLQQDQLLPDDAYSFPADMLPAHSTSVPRNVAAIADMYAVPNPHEEDVSYSLPIDVLPPDNNINSLSSSRNNFSLNKQHPGVMEVKEINNQPSIDRVINSSPATRPTQLDLRSPLTRINKPRYPDPSEACDSPSSGGQSSSSPAQLTNIAMAIDPTYSRRGGGYRTATSYDTSSSTVTTSTSSSSPGIVLPPPDVSELDEENPAPPYMPIQGQRRTASLEKKQKKKAKDGGCKQQ